MARGSRGSASRLTRLPHREGVVLSDILAACGTPPPDHLHHASNNYKYAEQKSTPQHGIIRLQSPRPKRYTLLSSVSSALRSVYTHARHQLNRNTHISRPPPARRENSPARLHTPALPVVLVSLYQSAARFRPTFFASVHVSPSVLASFTRSPRPQTKPKPLSR